MAAATDPGSDTATDTGTWSGVDVFGGGAPGDGNFVWTVSPTISVNTCGISGAMLGNGYIVSFVDPVAHTFTLQPSSGGAMDSTECSYDLSGAFSCGPESTVYDMATYGMVGTVTQIYKRTRTISGAAHTFSTSCSFDVVSTYTYECTGDAQSCQAAATNGWEFSGLPCNARVEG